ncbi:toll-like receptor 3 [Strongylocentrotus purpuratus]|uniref:TIR domain-containing protein n=1 Tax=Strongylocentrotus purpuratus TaxID=7668 RepID=A0A7M7PGJ3_STRPU|nr:toll-like receptor 3 [Strongylocentrotus purpuratus]
MANGSILYPLLVACLFVSSSFQSLHRHDGDSAMSSLTLDMDKSFHGCDQNVELKKASCSNKGLETIPQNLSGDTEVLDLSHNNITKLLNSSFETYPLINSLDISYNDIRVIEVAAFYPLRGLMHLDLSYNRRLVLPATGAFMMSSQLSILDLRSSNLKSLPNDTLKWSPNLDSVYLLYNQLSYINVSSRGMADNVRMGGNQLKHLTARYFTFVCHTDTLDLRKNPIQSVDADVIASLHVRSLVLGLHPLSYEVLTNIILGISKSAIEQLKINDGSVGESFQHLQSLVNLDMRDSFLQISDLWNKNANASLFDGLLDLIHLDLSSNRFLSDLPPGIFGQLSVLQELNLDYCEIRNLHPLVFSGLESLQNLSLKGNNIQHIHDDVLSGLVQLKSINFEGNRIAYLEELMFSDNWKLTNLSLADNRLTSLNQSTLKPIFSSISSLDLSMNPIDCNCDLKWLIDWLNEPIHLENKDETICSSASLEPLRENPLLDFDPNKLCLIKYGLYSLIPLAFISLVVLSVLLCHYRWQLRYKLYLLKLAVLGYKEMRDARDHNDYEFDVNIIFYDDDEEWIREQLRPALEERLPQFQRNVFGDQDLVLGMHYLDSVDYVVSHSYKTIIVLSRAAVHDHWFILKFRTAMDHVSDTLTEFVVVVFLEDIPDGEMPFLARLYLSDGRPYIHWTEDVRGQDYFWDELTKDLTINLRTNDLIPNE